MKSLLLGVFVVLAAALVTLTQVARLPNVNAYEITSERTLLHFTGTIVIVPFCAAWLTAEVFRFLRRPRVLDVRVPGFTGRFVRGAVVALIALIVSTALLVLFEDQVSDWLLSAGAMALAMSGGLMFAGRSPVGRCTRCGYDLVGVTPASKGLCPECGCDLLKTA